MPLKKLFVHAPNVHQGGGKSLLRAIASNISIGVDVVFCLDARMSLKNKATENFLIKQIKPSILKRFFAEKWLAKNVVSGDVVLCFGNLPPLFKLNGYVVVFIQNRYLIDNVKLDGLSFKTKLRILVERLWLFYRIENANELIVQTPSMKKILDARIKNKIPVNVMPFVDDSSGYVREIKKSEISKRKEFNFLYVASGEAHKNHKILIEAWKLLASDGFFPSLTLTLDDEDFCDLCSWIYQQADSYSLKVENKGKLSHAEVKSTYGQTSALIYPSLFESFGLPLVEARQAGLPVLASELDYVRDLLNPEEVFDPNSAVSIARAVKRFVGFNEPILPLKNAACFLNYLLNKGN